MSAKLNPPFSAQEIEQLRKEVFPSIPSFNRDDWTIASGDIEALFEKWGCGERRSADQISAYQAYWDAYSGGRVPFAVLGHILSEKHTNGPWLRAHMAACDKNKDGFIDKEEFEHALGIFKLHYPHWHKSNEDFAAEADTNHDGKVSIFEAAAWIEKHSPRDDK